MSAHLMSGEELFLLGVPSHGRGSKRDYIGDHLSQEDAGIQKWPVLLCIFHSLHRQRVACPSPICPHPKEEGFSTLNMDDPRRSITLQLYSQHSDLQFLFRQRCIESSAKYTGQRWHPMERIACRKITVSSLLLEDAILPSIYLYT